MPYGKSKGNSSGRNNEEKGERNSKKPYLTIVNSEANCMAKAMLKASQSNNNSTQISTSLTYESDYDSDYYNKYYLKQTNPQVSKTCCKCLEKEMSNLSVDMTAPMDWQADLLTPSQRLSTLFTYGHLTDLTITFDNSTKVYKAHRLVLAMASPVFERMLYGNTKEAQTGQVKFHDCSPDGFAWILENLYTGKTNLHSVYTALSVYAIAHQYNINGVLKLCKQYLKYEININNVSSIFSVARCLSEDYLLDACVKKITSSWSEVTGANLPNISEDMLLYMLEAEVLPVSELDLFKAIITWIKNQLEEDGEKVSPQIIREKLRKFMPKLRLLAIPVEKFVEEVIPTEIFTPEECSALLMNIRGISRPLPSGIECSKVANGRVLMNEDNIRYVILHRPSESKKYGSVSSKRLILIDNFVVSFPIIISQIQTQEGTALNESQMNLLDSEGNVCGIAKQSGAQWKFVNRTMLHANKSYKIIIDSMLVYNRISIRKEFCVHACDIKFRGSTGDNFLKLTFWPAQTKIN